MDIEVENHDRHRNRQWSRLSRRPGARCRRATGSGGHADGDVIGAVSVRLRELGATPDAETLRAMTATGEAAMLPVARSVGRLLFQLAVGSGAATIVEYGTSHGMSTLYLAAAAQRTGAQVIGTELSAHKAA